MPEPANASPTIESPLKADVSLGAVPPAAQGGDNTSPQQNPALAETRQMTLSNSTDNADSAGKATWRDVMSCFASTFVTIFLAELGDKTQVATLLMSAQSHKPMTVFLGAAMALISTSLVGVLLGRWLSKILSPQLLERVTGIILAIVSILLFIDVAGA